MIWRFFIYWLYVSPKLTHCIYIFLTKEYHRIKLQNDPRIPHTVNMNRLYVAECNRCSFSFLFAFQFTFSTRNHNRVCGVRFFVVETDVSGILFLFIILLTCINCWLETHQANGTPVPWIIYKSARTTMTKLLGKQISPPGNQGSYCQKATLHRYGPVARDNGLGFIKCSR